MAIDLLALEGNKVSRDLSGYITYIYAEGGAGKTSLGAQMPAPLLLSFEKGYSTIPGVFAQDINSWSEFRQVLRELKKKEVKEKFKTIVFDTVDIASQLAEKYICQQLGIENIGDGGWATNGWAKVKREWEQSIRSVIAEGYAVLFISHAKDKTFTRKNGTSYNQIVPSCSTAYNEIIRNMADLEIYIAVDEETKERRLILRCEDDSIECKSRFRYMDSNIPYGYQSLVDAINRAIDKEAEETNHQFITNERQKPTEVTTYDYDKLIDAFNKTTDAIMKKDSNAAPKVKVIIERYLGKGKKVSETTPDQAEFIYLIINDLKDELL